MTPLLLVAVVLLSACGGGRGKPAAEPTRAAAAPSAQELINATLEVAMADLYFGEAPDNLMSPPVWTVSAGDNVALTLVNNGTLQHDWAIVNPGVKVPVPFVPETSGELLWWEAGIVEPGDSSTFTFTAPTVPGEYIVICTVAGHYPSMQGRLVVKQAP